MKKLLLTLVAAAMSAGAATAQIQGVEMLRLGVRERADKTDAARYGFHAPMMRVTPGGTDLYGYLGETDDTSVMGLYEITGTPYNRMKWADPVYNLGSGPSMQSGWLYDGKVCGFSPVYRYQYITAIDYVEIDFATGQLLNQSELDLTDPFLMSTGAYNESDGYVYGYGSHGSGDEAEYCFMKAPVSDPCKLEVVKSYGRDPSGSCMSMTYNPIDRKIYGVTTEGNLVTVATDGTQQVVYKAAPDDMAPYFSGLAYSTEESLFYWQLCREDYSSALYTFDTSKHETSLVCDYSYAEEFMFFLSPKVTANPKAPESATISSLSFPNGATTGSISFTLPSKYADGSTISSSANVEWTVMLDGAEYRTGSNTPGTSTSVEFTGLSHSVHTFGVFAKVGNLESLLTTRSIYVGNDTPLAPQNVVLSHDGNLRWDAVTEGVNNGYVDAGRVSYVVRQNGSQIATATGTSTKITLDASQALASMNVEVYALCNGRESAPGLSNSIVVGKPMDLDVELTPTAAESTLFTTIDSNSDGNTWIYTTAYIQPSFAMVTYTPAEADEWLILPPVSINATDTYNRFSMKLRGSLDESTLEVMLGEAPTAEAMTTKLLSISSLNASAVNEEFSAFFKAPASGTYYIALHLKGSSKSFALLANDFSIKASTLTDKSPLAVTDLTAVAASGGKLQATVSFRMPTQTMDGNNIPAGATITATVTADETKSVTGAPGSSHSVTLRTVQGHNNIVVIPTLAGTSGIDVSIDVACGLDNPGPISNLDYTVSDDFMTANFTWDAPTEGDNGGFIIPEDCTYSIHLNEEPSTGAWVVIARDLTQTRYSYTLPKGSNQALRRLGVEVFNKTGYAEKIKTVYFLSGTPYKLPLYETFDKANNLFDNGPYVQYTPTTDYTCKWSMTAASQIPGGAGYMLTATPVSSSGKGRIAAPAFSTEGLTDVTLKMLVWAGSNSPISTKLMYQTYGMEEPVTFATVPRSGGWLDCTVTLPAAALNKKWVMIYFDCTMGASDQVLFIDNVSFTTTSALESTDIDHASRPSIRTTHEGIVVDVASSGDVITVCTVDGRIAARAVASDATIIPLPAGIYIVKAGATTAKVAVK